MNSSSENNMSSTTQPLCVKGCGFYSSSENRDMCSKCYKDYLKQELISISETLKSVSINEPEVEEKSEMKKIQKNRCDCCSKKVGLTGFNCRCGKLLCGMHRYPQEHACPFDFKELDRRVLSKQNVLVKADKLDARI